MATIIPFRPRKPAAAFSAQPAPNAGGFPPTQLSGLFSLADHTRTSVGVTFDWASETWHIDGYGPITADILTFIGDYRPAEDFFRHLQIRRPYGEPWRMLREGDTRVMDWVREPPPRSPTPLIEYGILPEAEQEWHDLVFVYQRLHREMLDAIRLGVPNRVPVRLHHASRWERRKAA